MLTGAGLGDDAGLAHALGEQGLAEHIVDLVAAGVVEILSLEEDAAAEFFAETMTFRQRRRTAGIGAQQMIELVPEGGITQASEGTVEFGTQEPGSPGRTCRRSRRSDPTRWVRPWS